MNYAEKLENVAVLGAAGKMGSGIVLLTAMELTDLSYQPENESREFAVNAIDVSESALTGLMKYLHAQVKRAAEKKTVWLRKLYENRDDLVENHEMIDQYINDVLAIVRPSTRLENAFQSGLVFEAINENLDLKVKLLSKINENSDKEIWVFTNTSSIPITELDDKVGLDGRALGVHFYNPPAVQKLVELISGHKTRQDLIDFAETYAKKLRKTIVPANDVAGFIGNGHFMRDILHAVSEVERLSGEYSFPEAVYMINKVSQEFLIRPMGIFQLTDYVGVDVCQCILEVMNERIHDEDLHSSLIDKMMEMGIKGGQYSSGAQKDGFLKYEKGRPQGVYDLEKGEYAAFSDLAPKCDKVLGPLPEAALPWKLMLMNPDKNEVLEKHFAQMKEMDTLGAKLAMKYGRRSCEIGKKLVADNVAANKEDVNKVLLTGFYHVYGPINHYFS